MWKMKKQDSKTTTESTLTSFPEIETVLSEVPPELEYIGFDTLEDFFSQNQIDDFKEQFPSYFEITGQTAISSVEFLPDETNYPDKDTTLLQFSLSDDTLLPVTYSASSGAFFFGEEKTQIKTDSRTYFHQTDETMSTITTEEIESRQEGGYADTKDDLILETEQVSAEQPDTSSPSTDNSERSDGEEVQP